MADDSLAPGTFLRVPLGDGSHGYARMLAFPHAAFLDVRARPDAERPDETALAAAPVLFTVAVHATALASWEVVGRLPISEHDARPPEEFMQDRTDPSRCRIVDSDGNERRVAPHECVGLERVAVWEADHVESRLLDTLEGRPNKWATSLEVRIPPST